MRIYNRSEGESTLVLTTSEAADHLKVSSRTLIRWRRRRIGPRWTYVGCQVRYRPADLEEYLESRVADPVGADDQRLRR